MASFKWRRWLLHGYGWQGLILIEVHVLLVEVVGLFS